MEFLDQWVWLFFIAAGLLLVLLELLVGVEAGLDLVIMGSALIIGGVATAIFSSWILTVGVSSGICLLYVVGGRRYVRDRVGGDSDSKTNIDVIIGKSGVVLKTITNTEAGLVKVGGENWRANADETIAEGEEVVVMDFKGVTLTVKKIEGG